MRRRDFIKTCGAVVGGAALAGGFSAVAKAGAGPDAANIRNYHPDMTYRPHGLTGATVSALGLGMMRPPMKEDGKTPDADKFIDMARFAIDHGLNYIDTSYVYLGGESEKITGRALGNGYRDRVYLSSKSPWWLMERPEDFERYFDESRRRLNTDHIDFYQLHMLMHRGWKDKAVPFRLVEKINKLKDEGKISYAGFSFHDGLPLFKKIIAANPWDFCLVQHNLLDGEHEAGAYGLQYAAANGMGVSIMEPLRGGVLAIPPKEVVEIYENYPDRRSPVEWALDYLWNKPEVSVAVSGMSDMKQLRENLGYAKRARPGMLSAADMALLGKVARQYNSYPGQVPCTGCYNCIPCPKNVAIGYLFTIVNNQYRVTHDLARAHRLATASMSPVQRGDKPGACDGCGQCLAKCPQGIDIPAELKRIDRELELYKL
ncbi:MAG: aldo/keto reductase [Desulfovibrio sp.]|nr:aldo/keto reductase [Desulfovibrio sp.]